MQATAADSALAPRSRPREPAPEPTGESRDRCSPGPVNAAPRAGVWVSEEGRASEGKPRKGGCLRPQLRASRGPGPEAAPSRPCAGGSGVLPPGAKPRGCVHLPAKRRRGGMEWSSDRHSSGSSWATWSKIGSGGKSRGASLLALLYCQVVWLISGSWHWLTRYQNGESC